MTRVELGKKLEEILGSDQVYFQPGTNTKFNHYPAIVYQFEGFSDRYAGNKRYISYGRYTVTHIYRNVKESLKDVFMDSFPFITFEDELRADGLYNDVYTIFC